MEKTFHITTFGCQMNEHDSEIMAGMLEEIGYERKEERRDAEILIINTCSVRDNADKRFFGTLGQLKHRHEDDPDLVVCVCGCMMQQKHVVDTINEKYPWVDIVFGTNNLHRLPHLLNDLLEKRDAAGVADAARVAEAARAAEAAEAAKAEKAAKSAESKENAKTANSAEAVKAGNVSSQDGSRKHKSHGRSDKTMEKPVEREIWDEAKEIVEGLPAERLHKCKALVNIMYGCNNFCTYCIVPYTRGRERSRTPEEILKEICALAQDGVKEVMLLGQNVNSYRGMWPCGVQYSFAELISEVAKIDGIERIRFMTSHPKDISDELIDLFRTCPKLCKNIHLPVQAGSDVVLKRMNRHYTSEMYLEEIRKLREAAPDITISTDIIVGFPGETEEDFQKTLDLVNEVRYDSAFTFLYSKRRGTPAESYEDQIQEDVMHERFGRLVDAIDTISAEKNAAYEGRVETVLVEGRSKRDSRTYAGRTDGFKLVNFTVPAGNNAAAESTSDDQNPYGDLTGKFVQVRITKGKTFSLEGELV